MEELYEFAMEKRLSRLSPALHQIFSDVVLALQHCLSSYQNLFPEYTDHTSLHCLSVIDFCNRLIGSQINMMNADEIFVLLTACYFHDTGMGISSKDFLEFSEKAGIRHLIETRFREDTPAMVREFHHEFSSMFIQKYGQIFDFPSEEYQWAVRMVARGHRKTNLMDEKEYPVAMPVPGGNRICLPYLAALIRLADEIDVTSERNPRILYHIDSLKSAKQIVYHKMTAAVRSLRVMEKEFILTLNPTEEDIRHHIDNMVEKMQQTLDTCRAAVNGRTPFVITQERVIVEELPEGQEKRTENG